MNSEAQSTGDSWSEGKGLSQPEASRSPSTLLTRAALLLLHTASAMTTFGILKQGGIWNGRGAFVFGFILLMLLSASVSRKFPRLAVMGVLVNGLGLLASFLPSLAK
jgi:hypothetical protein